MASDVVLQHLDYLLALAAERHFGRAAARCHISQPTLSVAIRRLERDLGIVIVQRGRRFEGFTDEGQRVVAWAHRITAERDEMLADLDRMQGRLTATARLGAIPTAVPASPFITAEFLSRNPAASVRIEALSSREIARRLADFEIDAGLTYLDDETLPGTRSVELYREQYVLVAPVEDPSMGKEEVMWADAAWLPQLAVPQGFSARPMVKHGPSPAIGLVVLDRAPASIVAGALVAVATDIDIADHIDRFWTEFLDHADGVRIRQSGDSTA